MIELDAINKYKLYYNVLCNDKLYVKHGYFKLIRNKIIYLRFFLMVKYLFKNYDVKRAAWLPLTRVRTRTRPPKW